MFVRNAIIITALAAKNIIQILFDDHEYTELFDNIRSKDFLGFTDLKPYKKRLEEIRSKTDLKDSDARSCR